VVVGSGATAVTLIPNIAADVPGGGAAHVTMLQVCPTARARGLPPATPADPWSSCAPW
jgi:hypothetical protein